MLEFVSENTIEAFDTVEEASAFLKKLNNLKVFKFKYDYVIASDYESALGFLGIKINDSIMVGVCEPEDYLDTAYVTLLDDTLVRIKGNHNPIGATKQGAFTIATAKNWCLYSGNGYLGEIYGLD